MTTDGGAQSTGNATGGAAKTSGGSSSAQQFFIGDEEGVDPEARDFFAFLEEETLRQATTESLCNYYYITTI